MNELTPLIEELETRLEGEVRFDDGSRALYARDASNFRMVPIGVVIPKREEDVLATVDACKRRGIPILSRGGGTSLAGQCCNVAVVIDFSKHMNRVLEIDPERRLARVEPGTVLDDLRKRAREVGLTFGPDPATHNRCTLGGMIGNNSCGVHGVLSEFYGPGPRVQDNLFDLDILTYRGDRMQVGETSEAELARIVETGGAQGAIYAKLSDLRDRYADLIRARFPDIPRRVSGYNLPCLLPEGGFHVGQALVGTEGTCVTVLQATVKLVFERPRRVLLVLGFDDVFAAGDAVAGVRALEQKPVACEGMDERLLEDIEQKGLFAEFVPLFPRGKGWLIVQFGADTHAEALDQAKAALASLGRGVVDHRLYTEADQSEGIWKIRESGLGATAFVRGQPDTWEGWEDSAVPPEKLGDYLRDLRALLERYGYRDAALYGHFAQGCVHTRIPFDLVTEAGVDAYRRFTRDAAELVVRYGGSLSGEHGDGQQRADLLPIMFGDELIQAFREFKGIWDPDGKMNPGKVVDPLPRTANLALGPDYRPARPKTHFPFASDRGSIAHAALRCVGVGECRRTEVTGVMCPSYMVLREEKHTTRGRAHLLHEMLEGDVIESGWRSEEVKEALDLCLSCKGCTHDCPVNVDLPTLKAEFLSHYWEGRARPRQAYAFGWIMRWAQIGSLVPELANLFIQTPGLRRLAKWMMGVHFDRTIPRFAKQTFRSWFRAQAPAGKGRRVMLWPDTFNDHFHPETLAAAARVLGEAGCQVVIPKRPLCCGRPLYDYGMLKTAKRFWREILDELEEEIERGTPLVGVEPSCTAAFKDELVKLFPEDARAQKLAKQTCSLAELLDRMEWRPPRLDGMRAIVHFHCHQQATSGVTSEERVLSSMGLELSRPQKTCCGMAGAFGMEKHNYDLSLAIGELGLLPAVRDASPETLLLANGFSCRNQIMDRTRRRPLHLAELIELAQQRSLIDGEVRLSAGAKVLVAAGVAAAGVLTLRAVTRAFDRSARRRRNRPRH
jgi:FAD/FMN-containing dehydrogenase/Fe-S oxidoreductase